MRSAKTVWRNVKVRRGQSIAAPLLELLDDRGIVCGGFVRWMCSPKRKPFPAGDIDIYPTDDSMYQEIVRDLAGKGFRKDYESPVAYSLKPSRGCEWGEDYPKVQVIKPINQGAVVAKGTIEEILDNFDFTVVRIGLKSQDLALADSRFEDDERRRYLRIINIHCPISSGLRVAKYVAKGYEADANTVLPLFTDWDSRSPGYREAIIAGVPLLTRDNMWELDEDELEHLSSLIYID